MRTIGIDAGSETHVVAVVDTEGLTVLRPTAIAEDAAGYARLLERLGDPADALVVMEATEHYWQNLFATQAARGFALALVNPLLGQDADLALPLVDIERWWRCPRGGRQPRCDGPWYPPVSGAAAIAAP